MRDGESSKEVPCYTIQSRPTDGGEPLTDRRPNGLPTEAGIPSARTLQWAISSSHMGPVFGDQDDFKLVRDGLWIAEAELQASWSPRVLVTDGEGRALPSAEVLLDGESYGRTDSRGMLQLQTDPLDMPSRFEVRSPNRKPEPQARTAGPGCGTGRRAWDTLPGSR